MSKIIFIQIPAYNEEALIHDVLREIPHQIAEFDATHVLVINDGSTDGTAGIAKRSGVRHILDFKNNRGLGFAFRNGLAYALAHGADIIVNTDGDNQYAAAEIVKLVEPIVRGQADVVIGNRQLPKIQGYPWHKLMAQSLGNACIGLLFASPVQDATSGFRAFSKEAAGFLIRNLTNDYTYTIESLCVLFKYKMRVVFVPVVIRYPTRTSRLIKSKMAYVTNFIVTALRMKFIKVAVSCRNQPC